MPRGLANVGSRRRRAALVFVVPLLVSAAAVTILVTCFHSKFLINDDTTLASLVNGDYTGKRSSSLVVAPAMFGHVVRLGYAAFPRLPWYGITLYTLQIVAWAVIGTTVFMVRRRPPLLERILVVATIVAVAPWMILRVSFTATSLLVGVAGIIVFAAAANVRRGVGWVYAVVAGVLLGSVYLLRVYAFLAVVVAFAPVIAVVAVKAGLRRSAAVALVVGVFVLVGFGTNRLEYSRSAEWRAFMKMNSARSSLHSTPRLDDQNVSDRDLQRIGWTRNDLYLFADFIYPDSEVYSDHHIRTLAALAPRVRSDLGIGDIYGTLVHDSSDQSVDRGPVLASLVIVGVLLALRWNRTAALATLASAVWFVGVLVTLLLYVRLPGRVLVPLEAGATLIAAVAPTYLTGSPPRTSARLPLTSVVAAMLVFVAGPVWNGLRSASQMSSENQRGTRVQNATLDQLEEVDPEGVFVARGDLFGKFAEPLATRTPFANPRLVPLGWATNSPLFTARLARLGIDDLYTALSTNRHVYLFGTEEQARRIRIFYREHRGGSVAFHQLPEVVAGNADRHHGLFIWSVTLKTP
jgi:hypothetical protein